MEKFGIRETVPALLNPSPNTTLMPAPRKVSASPLTTWSAWSVITMKAWIWLMRPANNMAASTPIHGLPVAMVTLKPVIAPISIMPSTPRFKTPERSEKISPSVAKSKTVPLATPACRMMMKSMLYSSASVSALSRAKRTR